MQDLTPQLRTRLSRVERAVGVFVLVATLLLLTGFGYYLWHTADQKGWFVAKVRYFTYVDTATGLSIGSKVKLMGREIGEITKVETMPPFFPDGDIYVEFIVRAHYNGYIWTDGTYAHINAGSLLDGSRYIELSKGTNGVPAYAFWGVKKLEFRAAVALSPEELKPLVFFRHIDDPASKKRIATAVKPVTKEKLAALEPLKLQTLEVFDKRVAHKLPTFVWNDTEGAYQPVTNGTKPYHILPRESPALTERLEKVAGQIELALPGILNLTNRIEAVLVSANVMLTNLNTTLIGVRPVLSEATNVLASLKPAVASATNLLASLNPAISNVTLITANLTRPKGALGDWLIPTNIQAQLTQTLATADSTLATANKALATANATIGRASDTMNNVDTNLTFLILSLNRTLDNVASMTSNFNSQVQANTNLVKEVSDAIIHADDLMQGLKKHWLLRSAFKTNAPPTKSSSPRSGKPK